MNNILNEVLINVRQERSNSQDTWACEKHPGLAESGSCLKLELREIYSSYIEFCIWIFTLTNQHIQLTQNYYSISPLGFITKQL